jgi:hypothetical protein
MRQPAISPLHIRTKKTLCMVTINAHSLVNPSHFMRITEMLIHEDDWSETYALSETYANVGDKLMMIPGYNII